MNAPERLSTGVADLDEKLGGGLLPGTLTVLVGSTGIGKTQLGLQFAHAGAAQEGRRGIFFDLSARGDSQSHVEYAQRMFDWQLAAEAPTADVDRQAIFDAGVTPGEYLRIFDYQGRRVTRQDLDFDGWHDWQAELTRRLNRSIGFFYSHFIRDVRRAVLDGIEPVDRPSDSIQFELIEYIYHQVLRKKADWVARDLLREHYRENAATVAEHLYDPAAIGCMILYTSHETTLEAQIERPLDEGGLLAGANTVIHLGKIREGTRFRRAMYVAKHRGSVCPDEILPYEIDDRGLRLTD